MTQLAEAPVPVRHHREPVASPEPAARLRLLALYGAIALLANVFLLASVDVPLLTPTLGVLFCVVLPVFLLLGKVDFGGAKGAQRVIMCITLTIGLLLVLGLILNFGLAAVGVSRPLDTVPLTLGMDALLGVLTAFRPQRLTLVRFRNPFSSDENGVVLLSLIAVTLSVAGAVRLNNGSGGQIASVMLAVVVLTFARLIFIRNRIGEAAIALSVYLQSLALLFMTSLRGWYVTGHDIQHEYSVFQLTNRNGNWSPERVHDAYNACLSITLLPTLLLKLTGIGDIYVFKILFQLLFALCPVAVYLIARSFGGRGVGLLGTLYFVAFPTYQNDMPFICRQEIGFLFLAAALLIIVQGTPSRKTARGWLIAFSVGIVVTHYSTSYVFAGMLTISWLVLKIYNLVKESAGRHRSQLRRPTLLPRQVVVAFVNVLIVAGLSVLWYGPITGTSSGLGKTLTSAARSAIGLQSGQRSSDVNYGLFSSAQSTPQQRLDAYATKTIADSKRDRAIGAYYPLSLSQQYETTSIPLQNLPVTSLGSDLASAHIPVASANGKIRQGIAKLLQVFILIGLILVAVRGLKSKLAVTQEFFLLAVGSVLIIGAQTVLPSLSVDYGVLRAFQQALFVLAPFLAVGSIALLRPLGRAAPAAAAGVGLAVFVSTSGLLPQLTGDYPAQLNLNNSGSYYNLYYVHPEEVAGIQWVDAQTPATEVQADSYTAGRLLAYATGEPISEDIYPTIVRTSTYVFLGYGNVVSDTSSIYFDGDIINYRYPVAFLKQVKSLVYSNGGSEIFR